MSTFDGHLEEIPGISIDCFNEANLNSHIFLLSHCHSDHITGMKESFFRTLKETGRYIYCSSISKLILEDKFSIAELNVIKVLKLNIPETITSSITVTCIASGHCLGSVMFIIEKNDISILYTGDFRYNSKDLSKIKSLHSIDGFCPRSFKRIYLDTTFLNKSFLRFPTREESMKEICIIIKDWLKKDGNNIVSLECSANYGAEYLFTELAKFFKTQIHVKSFLLQTYRRIPEIVPYITDDVNVRMHACCLKFDKILKCCPHIDAGNILTVVASAQYWKNKQLLSISERNTKRNNVFNVCYSTHSSYEELVAFINYFQCKDIFPCVDNKVVQNELKEIIDSIQNESNENDSVEDMKYDFSLTLPRPTNFQIDTLICDDDAEF